MTQSFQRTPASLIAPPTTFPPPLARIATNSHLRCMPMFRRERYRLRLPSRTLQLGERTLIMGILNVTPDSFYAGGRYADAQLAVRSEERRVGKEYSTRCRTTYS